MRTRRILASMALGLGLLPVLASAAAADPPRPTNYESVVLAVEPAVSGVSFDVIGGDAFLEMRVDPGHRAVVFDYPGSIDAEPRPYLRVDETGLVEVNRNSYGNYQNNDRYARVALPDDLDSRTEPAWERVGDDGTYVWHDHRIHWMSTGPMRVDELPWAVDVEVDGTPARVTGVLRPVDAPSPLPWVAVVLVAGAVVLAVGWRQRRPVALTALALAAAVALWAGWGERSAVPAGAGGSNLPVVLPVAALVLLVASVGLRRRPAGPLCALAAAAVLGGWAILRLPALWHAILPTTLPAAIDRLVISAVLGTVAAAAVLLVRDRFLLPAGSTTPAGERD